MNKHHFREWKNAHNDQWPHGADYTCVIYLFWIFVFLHLLQEKTVLIVQSFIHRVVHNGNYHILSENISTSPIQHESLNPLKHGKYLTTNIHWIIEKKNVFVSSKGLKKKCISYPFGVRQSMVGEGCDEAGVHHPERISHALRHFSFFLFSFICCHHRLCKHHLYNQQPCNHSPCKYNFYDHHPCNYHPCIHPLHIHHLQSLHGIFIGEIVASEDDSDPIAPSNSERRSQDVDRCISLIVHSQAADDINNNN